MLRGRKCKLRRQINLYSHFYFLLVKCHLAGRQEINKEISLSNYIIEEKKLNFSKAQLA